MIKYFTNPTGNADVMDKIRDGTFGWIDSPEQAKIRIPGAAWCLDNGCFSTAYLESKWWAYVERSAVDADTCWFATAPDRVGDAAATLELSLPWLPKIRALGYPAGFVIQDGQDGLPVPWDEFDVMFIGGSNQWKLGNAVMGLTAEALDRGKEVHMGRVNSFKRLRYAHWLGCHSADGTFITFAPTENLGRMMRWVEKLNNEEGATLL